MTAAADSPRWSIAIHGGAGVADRATLTDETDAALRAGLAEALEAGAAVLRGGGSALDAAETAVRTLEDNPLFNAGRGAVFTAEGRNELDASIMDGRTRAAGAVAAITRTRHPVTLAREVMAHSPHVMLVGEGAETFARMRGVEEVDPAYFFTERRWQSLVRELGERGAPIPPRPAGAPAAAGDGGGAAQLVDDHRFGTVGAVAYDTHRNAAAATSTGGTTAKAWGRVGDTPIIGAGTYAQNGVCAVSATGAGEYFIRLGVARTICALVELCGMNAGEAASEVIGKQLTGMGGEGGVIVMDGRGRAIWRYNTSGMYRARVEDGGAPIVRIFADEDR
jgi:beta-aspartyl-peptidase (threonine type)